MVQSDRLSFSVDGDGTVEIIDRHSNVSHRIPVDRLALRVNAEPQSVSHSIRVATRYNIQTYPFVDVVGGVLELLTGSSMGIDAGLHVPAVIIPTIPTFLAFFMCAAFFTKWLVCSQHSPFGQALRDPDLTATGVSHASDRSTASSHFASSEGSGQVIHVVTDACSQGTRRRTDRTDPGAPADGVIANGVVHVARDTPSRPQSDRKNR